MGCVLSSLTTYFGPSIDPFSRPVWLALEGREKLGRLRRWIQIMISDAEEREVVDESEQLFLSQLRRLALDIENVLDEYEYELLCAMAEGGAHRQRERGEAAPSDSAVSIWTKDDSLLRDWMARQTEDTMRRFEEIQYQRRETVVSNREMREMYSGSRSRQPGSSPVDQSYVCGRDDEKEMLINYLVSDADDGRAGSDLSVIAVVGPALVGKTTLATLIYDDPRVVQRFDCRAWVSVTEGFDLLTTLQHVSEYLPSSEPYPCDQLSVILKILPELLVGNRILLVLDDLCVVNSRQWGMLVDTLRPASQGSVILITTQDENVANMTRTVPIFFVEGLSGDDCWLIFKFCACDREEDSVEGSEVAAIRAKVIELCGGMPLVAKLLAASFRNKPDGEAWTDVVERVIEDGTLPELVHGYRRLPADLKRCLLYCSLFPKSYLFRKDQVVRLWTAQGLIQQTDEERLEDTGIQCFEELLSRSFFLQSETEQWLYFMPGLMCDLVYSLSRNLHSRVVDIQCLPSEAIHLSLSCKSTIQCESFYKYSALRSFLVMQAFPYTSIMHLGVQDEMFLKLKYLRSLDLSCTDVQMLPDSVGNLKHLRFLALNHTQIKRLPESIHKLYHLQTLELKDCPWLQELPRGIGSLINLRHLDVDSRHLVHMPFQIQKLTNLQELPIFNLREDNKFCGPRELQYLANLTELGISGLCNVTNLKDAKRADLLSKRYLKILKLVWPSIDSVQNSEELGDPDHQKFLISDGETGKEDEENVNNLRNERGSTDEQYSDHEKLSSCDVDDMAERLIGIPDEHDSNFSSIQFRHGIICMGTKDYVSCDAAISEEDLLESLRPSTMLETLYIKSYGGARFPDWIGDSSFSELMHVELVSCKCLVLPPFGRLQKLKFLRIDGMPVESAGIEFCGMIPDAFPHLEILSFQNMNKWKKWDGGKKGDFPSLSKLCLFNCPQLRMVPKVFSSLKVLEVERCMELTDIPTSPLLQVLKLHSCDGLTVLPSLVSLRSLTVMYCQKLKSLPLLPELENIWIEDCDQLRSIVHCSCCPSSAELSCRISHERLLVSHCHQLCLPLAGLLDYPQYSNTGCCLVLSKFDKTHRNGNQ